MSCTVFERVRIFDGVNPQLTDEMSVLIDGNEIKEVTDGPIKANSADRVECNGRTLMPGLIDNHVHIYIESLNLNPPEPPITYRAQFARKFLSYMLSCGFTAVRDVAGGDHGMAMALRDRFFEGPRFFYGGLCLTQTGGHGDMRLMSQPSDACCGAERNMFAVHADGVDDCIKAVREELRKGAHHIKILASGGILSPGGTLDRCEYSESEIRAIVEECNRQGVYVCAHAYPSRAIRRCVDFGVRCIEHGTLIDAETAQVVANKGAYVVPTVAVVFALMDDLFARKGGDERVDMLEISRQKLLKINEHALQGLEVMKRAGVKMGFGTDLQGMEQYKRQGQEFTIRNQVLTPFEILHSATAVNGEILQMDGKLGVVKPGALADLIVVDGNPLADINLIAAGGRFLTHIMANGQFVKRAGS